MPGISSALGGQISRPKGLTRLGWPRELAPFLAAYAVYNLARWVFVGDVDQAQEHARWIVDLERDAGLAFEHSVQRALDSGATAFLLSNAYLAAQLLVLPGSLIWLYRRSQEMYRVLGRPISPHPTGRQPPRGHTV